MNSLVKELESLRIEKRLSLEAIGRYLGCSMRTVHRWTQGQNSPSFKYQRVIRDGINRIKEDFPVEIRDEIKNHPYLQALNNICIDDLSLLSEKEKDFWEEVIFRMTPEERGTVFHSGNDKKIAEKYIIKAAKRLNINPPKQ